MTRLGMSSAAARTYAKVTGVSRTEGAWRRFARRYGWRAYALPVLLAVTVAVVVKPTHRASAAESAAPARVVVTSGAAAPAAATPAATTPAPVTLAVGQDSTRCLDNTSGRLALVSISQQHVWMCDGPKQVYSTSATTGAVTLDEATPTGSWVVQGKQTDRYLVGPGYKDFVRFWVPFNGDFGFHDASWQTFPFGNLTEYRTKGSNGCVHLPTSAMSWFYSWAQVGSTVVTVDA